MLPSCPDAGGREQAFALARERFLELLAAADTPAQLAALLRVIDKVPWKEREAGPRPLLSAFTDLEAMQLPELAAEAERLLALLGESRELTAASLEHESERADDAPPGSAAAEPAGGGSD